MTRKRSAFILACIVLLTLLAAGCTSVSVNKENENRIDCFSLTKNADNTYSYRLTDLEGRLLFEKENSVKEPRVELIAESVYEMKTQTGTGRSTNWAVYCDVENSKTSDIFYYVLEAKNDYVVYANYQDGEHSVIVQNIFDKAECYKVYKLNDVSPVAADFIVDCQENDDGSVTITYLAGDDYTEMEITISLP